MSRLIGHKVTNINLVLEKDEEDIFKQVINKTVKTPNYMTSNMRTVQENLYDVLEALGIDQNHDRIMKDETKLKLNFKQLRTESLKIWE